MTNDQIYLILQPIIKRVSGCPVVIKYAQNADSPKGEYGSIQVTDRADERGQANITRKKLPDGSIEETVKAQVMKTVVVEFYRGAAHDYAIKLFQMGKRQDVSWDLFKHKISIRNTGSIIDLTALQSSNYEARSRIDLYLWLEESNSYILNPIEGVGFSVSYEGNSIVQSGNVKLKGA